MIRLKITHTQQFHEQYLELTEDLPNLALTLGSPGYVLLDLFSSSFPCAHEKDSGLIAFQLK